MIKRRADSRTPRTARRKPGFPWAVLVLALALAGLAGPGTTACGAAAKADPGDLVLPMPGEGTMAFRPVFLGTGPGPFAAKRFVVGDPFEGYKEHPVPVSLGGALQARENGREDRLFYMGKYEVTRAQYDAVMGGGAPGGGRSGPDYPITGISYFEAAAFIDAYNQWLMSHAADKLPPAEDVTSFLRLPTEEEWEFCARGGTEVAADIFDQKHPYGDALAAHEWFAGEHSSHNKIQMVGGLKPNPLKIYDMLGNVAEMTCDLYQVEYYQGTNGGFVSRGGHYFTQESQMRSSLRQEQPFYSGSRNKGFSPNRQATLGFRLVVSCPVFTGRKAAQRFADGWASYSQEEAKALPAALAAAPVDDKVSVQQADAMVHFQRLKEELSKGIGLSAKARQELGLLGAIVSDINKTVTQAANDSAYAWVKIAAERGLFIHREHKKIPIINKLIAIAEADAIQDKLGKYKQRRKEFLQNIEEASLTYAEAFKQLGSIKREAVDKAFETYLDKLRSANSKEQLDVFHFTKQHYNQYIDTKKLYTKQWSDDLAR